MDKSIFYFKQLTATEVGNKGTHEIYIRMPNDFDSTEFFQSELDNNNGVLEKKFKAKNLTKGHETDELIDLRFVYFEQSNKEKRIPSLGELFKANNVNENDIVKLESRIENNIPLYYITFLKPDEIKINPKSFCYSVINNKPVDGIEKKNAPLVKENLQQIYYGAPGTGKSHTIKEVTRNEDVVRTTFHPDTDYSSFVGAYKPTTIEETVMTVIGTKAVPVEDADGNERKESKIIYEFVAQSFLQAYIAAWKKYAGTENCEPEKQFLVIEEINRGNCAQIFGDLFQLLDRNDYGFSEYPIKADADMKKQLQKAFKGLDIPQKHNINVMYEARDVVKDVLDGDLLLLPNNLYIWATMNTSDQSLFPIDSAFKRRWDWTYIPISNANKGWTINIGDSHYDWWQFVERINDLIGRTTNSEDKKLGYFFCKAMEGEISADTFVGKVIFYLWNDVFKDYDFCDQVFNDANGNKLTFDKFYTAEGNNSKVVEEKVKLFLKNLGLEASVQQENMDEDIDSKIIIKVNGKDVTKVNAIPYTAIEEYVKLHSEMSAQEVIDIWKPFKKCSMRSWIVCNKKEHDEMDQRYANYSYEIKCTDGNSLWVNKDGWMHHPENKNLRDTVSEFIEAVNGADLGITITETTI